MNFPRIFTVAFSKKAADRMLLISSDYSLTISRTPFVNPSLHGVNKRPYIFKQYFIHTLRLLGLF